MAMAARRTALVALLALVLIMCLLLLRSGDQGQRRVLSASTELQSTDIVKTYNGIVPVSPCAIGYYRPDGNSKLAMVSPQRSDGCAACPRGRYGSTAGLTSSSCSGPCPIGRYGDKVGLTSTDDCSLCPPGYVGSATGSTTNKCTSACDAGKYSSIYGASKSSACVSCPAGYRGWQCTWALQPGRGRDQDHQHLETFGLDDEFTDPIPQ